MEKIRNKKATHNYEILDTLEAGIELFGFEVASIKKRTVSFEGSYLIIDKNNEVFLKNFHISPFQEKNTPDWYTPERPRKILLRRSQVESFKKSLNTKGQTLIPLSLYVKGRKIKFEVALVRGKNKADKRQDMKSKDAKRDIARTMKEY